MFLLLEISSVSLPAHFLLEWNLNLCLVVQPKCENCQTLNARFIFINLTCACKWYLLVQTSSSLTASPFVPPLCWLLFCLQSRNTTAERMPWEDCIENTSPEWMDDCGLIQLHEGKFKITLTFFFIGRVLLLGEKLDYHISIQKVQCS